MDTFNQILEMDDDDDDHEFSKSIVFGFFDQANSTLEKIDKAMSVAHQNLSSHSLRVMICD